MNDVIDRPPIVSIRSDLLIGAAEISMYIHGTPNRTRWVYNKARTSQMPCFHAGGQLCARKSEIDQWLRAKK